MIATTLPTELLLAIFSNVIDQTQIDDMDGMHALHPLTKMTIRLQRLKSFRRLARVCKMWLGPARTVFWTEVVLFSLSQMIAFAGAIHNSEARPACIRSLYFCILCGPKTTGTVGAKVRRCFPDALRRLPSHLDVLGVEIHGGDCSALYDVLMPTPNDHPDPPWTIDVHKLFIGHRPNRNVFPPLFALTRNVVHLVLRISKSDVFDIMEPPCHASMQLKSLAIIIESWSFDLVLEITRCLTEIILMPACTNLQSLTIFLDTPDYWESSHTETIKDIFSLRSSTLSTFNLLVYTRWRSPFKMGKALADAGAFTQFNTLRNLGLCNIDIYPDIFRQMGCLGLRTLEVTVVEGEQVGNPPVRDDGREAMANILESLALPELANLERLTIKFTSMFSGVIWNGMKDTWVPVEEECANRKIECIIKYPDMSLPARALLC